MAGIADTIRAQKKLNVRKSDQGGLLVGVPSALQINDQVNVMFLMFEMDIEGEITINLVYLDPQQFCKKDSEAVAS